MIDALFWTILRSVAIPFVAFIVLKETPLGEEGALLAIGITLFIVTIISIGLNILKILGNTLLFRGKQIIILILKIVIQLTALGIIWIHYFNVYQ